MRTTKLFWALAALLLISNSMHVRAEGVEDSEEEDEYEDVARAHLIVRKSVGDELVVQGRNVTVTISIFNAGAASAKAVTLEDVIPSNATLLDGSLTATFPRIAEGSSVQHTYTMTFNAGGAGMVLPSASVKYQAEEGSVQTGESSQVGIYVMTPVQKITRSAVYVGTYVSLGMARSPADWRNMFIIAAVVGIVVGGNYAFSSMTTAKTSRRRQKALQDLGEKDE